eukprot:COSAG01_NODE_1377_length_10527_cov_806.883679_9_plen_81_part_00
MFSSDDLLGWGSPQSAVGFADETVDLSIVNCHCRYITCKQAMYYDLCTVDGHGPTGNVQNTRMSLRAGSQIFRYPKYLPV